MVDTLVWRGGQLAPLDANDAPKSKGMTDAKPVHKQRARRSLERHVTRTREQLIAAGSSWRAINEMREAGELVTIGSTPCAKLVYALTPAEEHYAQRCEPLR
jgi:hypothetical protein